MSSCGNARLIDGRFRIECHFFGMGFQLVFPAPVTAGKPCPERGKTA